MCKRYLAAAAMLVFAAVPVVSHAAARLVSVVPVGGGCVSGPTGPAVQAWDVEPGQTYTLTITHAIECSNGGTDPTMNVRVNSTTHGNTDIVATNVGVGVYQFDYTMPTDAVCTFPIFYCTTPGNNASGSFVVRNDGGMFQAHLRAASFSAGCTNPVQLKGPDCMTVPTDNKTWGAIKVLYR